MGLSPCRTPPALKSAPLFPFRAGNVLTRFDDLQAQSVSANGGTLDIAYMTLDATAGSIDLSLTAVTTTFTEIDVIDADYDSSLEIGGESNISITTLNGSATATGAAMRYSDASDVSVGTLTGNWTSITINDGVTSFDDGSPYIGDLHVEGGTLNLSGSGALSAAATEVDSGTFNLNAADTEFESASFYLNGGTINVNGNGTEINGVTSRRQNPSTCPAGDTEIGSIEV